MNFNRFDDEWLQYFQRTEENKKKKKDPPKHKVIIWLDTDTKKTQRESTNTKYFSDVNKCIDEMSDMVGTDIYFLLNCNTMPDDEINNLVSILQPFIQIRLIYVLYSRSIIQRLQKSSKVRQLFTEPTEQQMRRETRTYEEQLSFEFSTTSKNVTLSYQTNNRQEASIIYTQLFKHILLDTDSIDSDQAEKERVEMINYCRQIHTQVNDQSALAYLDRYETSRDLSPIWWYTCDAFFYRMLNEACRNLDIETMYAMRGYIRDLHREIERLYDPSTTSLLLYRGQQLSAKAFNEIKTKLGGLLSVHSFFSTTLNRDLALVFAGAMDDVDCISVLFEITVPTFNTDIISLANIDSVSAFGDAEQEYLFSFGCIFRINSLTRCSTFGDIWVVQLALTGDSDPDLVHLSEHMWTNDLRGKSRATKFARLMLDMGEPQLAQDIYLSLVQEPRAREDLNLIYHQLGYIHQMQGKYDLSLAFYNQALNYNIRCEEDDGHSMIADLLGIAQVYGLKDDWISSLEYAQRALVTANKYSKDEEEKANCLHIVGMALLEQQQSTEAIEYIQQALDIRHRILPSLHPSLGVSYNDLGSAYKQQERYEEALLAYQKSLEIRRRCLSEGHWAFAVIFNNLANILYWLERDDEALQLSGQAVEIATRALGMDHPTTEICRETFDGISAEREESQGI